MKAYKYYFLFFLSSVLTLFVTAQIRYEIVEKNHLWGLINKEGKVAISLEYDSVKIENRIMVSDDHPFYVVYKNGKRGLIVEDIVNDAVGEKKYALRCVIPAELDSFKSDYPVILAYKNNKMAVYTIYGKLFFPYDTIRSGCSFSLRDPDTMLMLSKGINNLKVMYNKKIQKVERLRKKNNKYASYHDLLLSYGKKYFRIGYGNDVLKKPGTFPEEVKLSRIIKEEIEWFEKKYCNIHSGVSNTY